MLRESARWAHDAHTDTHNHFVSFFVELLSSEPEVNGGEG